MTPDHAGGELASQAPRSSVGRELELGDPGRARGRERLRRIGLTGAVTLAARGVNIAASLITIPLTARYFGTERFGLWMLLGSFLSWVSLADLGLTNTITTELARADGRGDRQGAGVLVSSAFFPILLISLLAAGLFAVAFPWVSWGELFNVTSPVALGEASAAAVVTMGLFVARLPLALPGRIYAAYQEGYKYQLWSGAGNVLAVGALLLALERQASLPTALVAFYGTVLLGDLGAGAHLFAFSRPWLAPRLRQVERKVFRSLLSTGAMFWVAQIAAILLLQTDLIIVTQLFGAKQVADYGVALKLFGLVGFVQMAFANALWPAYAEALARRDLKWVDRTFARSITLAGAWSGGASLALVLVGGWLVQVLVAGKSAPDPWLLAAMATTAIVTAVGQSFAMLLNGLGEIRIQAVLGIASGLFNLGVSIVLGRWLGAAGVALGTTAAVVVSLALSARFLRARLSELRARSS